jgi:3-hydroxy-9,10-secoandrosta-1,3,5(10)-triene-9,17-dione monooxygenase
MLSSRMHDVPSRDELLRRAEALVPVLRERADQCEKMRRCPAETVADFESNGLIRICQPARYGGYELGWDVRSEVCEVLARGCGSQAWIHHILTDHSQKLGAFDIRAQDDVWGKNPHARIGAGLDPVGKARRVPGGVIYAGRHGFSSGIDHVQWLICGGHIFEDGVPPQRCFFLVPKSEATVIDDWHVMGLAGTGSKSFEVKETFVPEHRIIDAIAADDGRGPGVQVNAAPIFRVPFASVAATGFAAVAVGIAEGFLDDWTSYTRSRSSRGTSVATLMGTQIDAGHAAIEIHTARRMYLAAAQDAMETLTRGEKLSECQRLQSRLSASFAAQLSLGAVQRLFNAAGGRANYSRNVLQRQLRDLQAAASHVSIVWNTTTAAYGGYLLGAASADPITSHERLPH